MTSAHNENSVIYTPGPIKSNTTTNPSFKCESCEFSCSSKPSLKRHMTVTHPDAGKGNIGRYVLKRKLPEKREKCDLCGKMLLNLKGLSIHKKQIHAVEENNLNQQLSRSDSVKSSKSVQSVTSPPPKRHEKDSKQNETLKKQEYHSENMEIHQSIKMQKKDEEILALQSMVKELQEKLVTRGANDVSRKALEPVIDVIEVLEEEVVIKTPKMVTLTAPKIGKARLQPQIPSSQTFSSCAHRQELVIEDIPEFEFNCEKCGKGFSHKAN